MLTNRIQGKTVLITGASSGIGRACAYAFARLGARLILVARRIDALTKLEQELCNDYQIEILIKQLDVTDKTQVTQFFSNLPASFSQIDILVNNAGLALELATVKDGQVTNWETMLDTNLKGLLYMTQEVLKIMYAKQSGHIINLGSISGIYPYANAAVYCATKAAVHAFSRALREECIEKNIKVSEVMPGLVNTEFSMIRFNGDVKKANSVYQGMDPLSGEDIADLIIYLANLPWHVNVAETLILPSSQATPTKISRKQ